LLLEHMRDWSLEETEREVRVNLQVMSVLLRLHRFLHLLAIERG
jgi:hypothetical protein